MSAGEGKRRVRRDGDTADEGDALADGVELHLQRRLRLFAALQQPGDGAHLGAHPGRRHHQLGSPTGEAGVHVRHAGPLSQRHPLAGPGGHRTGVLTDRLGLPGQRGLVDLHRFGNEQPTVGGQPVARFEQDQIAGYEPSRVLDPVPAAAAHPGGRHEHVAQRLQAALRPTFLDKADGGIDEQHDGDDDGVLHIANRSGEQGSAEQDADEQAAELVQEAQPRWSARAFSEPVRAVRLLSSPDLGVVEAGGRLQVEVPNDVHGRAQVRVGDGAVGGSPPGRRPDGAHGSRRS